MASKHSYIITKSNNITEKEGLNYLLEKDKGFVLLDKDNRKVLMQMFDIDKRFYRAFDLLYIPGGLSGNIITEKDKDNIILVELKTTKKNLPNNPKGFFFGATKNEFDLAKQLGDKYMFCFVSMYPDNFSHSLIALKELESMIKTKRIQYQINLES